MKQFTKEQALDFAENRRWEGMNYNEIAAFQLEQNLLCMPWAVFHEAVEKALGRPVWTHEFGFNQEGLKQELAGACAAPSFADVLDMIPEDKQIIVACVGSEDKK